MTYHLRMKAKCEQYSNCTLKLYNRATAELVVDTGCSDIDSVPIQEREGKVMAKYMHILLFGISVVLRSNAGIADEDTTMVMGIEVAEKQVTFNCSITSTDTVE